MNARRSARPPAAPAVDAAAGEPDPLVTLAAGLEAAPGGHPAGAVPPDDAGPAAPSGAGALLPVRVSDLLARYPAMLAVLIDHGFAPLAQPALRAVLAPTVTLAQALRIRSLDEEREQDLLRCLVEVAGAAREEG